MTFARVNIADLRSKQESEALSRNSQRKAANMRVNAMPIRNPRGVMGGCSSGVAIEKENASQSSAYMAAVRALGYCMRCGCTLKKGEGQFCHADQGKGTGIKTDVRRGWLGCPACHEYVGTSGRMRKADRRAEEDRLGAKTRELVLRAGTWPKKLPKLKETTR